MDLLEELAAAKKVDLAECSTLSAAYDAGFYEGVGMILSLYEHQDSIEQFEQESEEVRAIAEDMYFNNRVIKKVLTDKAFVKAVAEAFHNLPKEDGLCPMCHTKLKPFPNFETYYFCPECGYQQISNKELGIED